MNPKTGTKGLPALVAQQTMHEIERLVRGMQRHWLIRKSVEQADIAATNQRQPRQEAIRHEDLDQFRAASFPLSSTVGFYPMAKGQPIA